MNIRLTHIDGKLPNLALMKLAHWHKAKGDAVHLACTPSPDMFESPYQIVYGSAIFEWSQPVIKRLCEAYPQAIVAGTGTRDYQTVEQIIGQEQYEHYDYSIYPEFPFSIGFSQRGCRLNCGFCIVPKKEGKPRSTNTIFDIWRGEPTPRNVVLLDNDFFGQQETDWRARVEEMRKGRFRVNFCQGINIRMITPESAKAIAGLDYYNTSFTARRIYTAWDNLGQEKVFFKGFELLKAAGVRPDHLMVYMLVGYKPGETMEEVLYRYGALKSAGCKPYPMVFDNKSKELKRFQRWVIRRYDELVSWEDFAARTPPTKILQGAGLF